MGNAESVDRIPLAMHGHEAGDVCLRNRQSAKEESGGALKVSEGKDTLESFEDWQRSVSNDLRTRLNEWKSRENRGREWIGRVMSSEVKSSKAVRDITLKEAQERHTERCKLKEDERRCRASAKVTSQLNHDPEQVARWDAVMEKVPAEGVGMSALRRSLRTHHGWTSASGGGKRSPVPIAWPFSEHADLTHNEELLNPL